MFDPYIRVHARHRPFASAVCRLGGEVSYARFDAEIDGVANALLELGLGGARLAAIALADPYLQWLVVLALGRLGIASATLGISDGVETVTLLNADLFVADQPAPLTGARTLHATPQWFAKAAAAPAKPLPPVEHRAGALARVTLSSGTTGARKMVGRTWGQLTAYAHSRALMTACMTAGQGRGLRSLYLLGPDTVAFYNMLATWLGGGTLIVPTAELASDPVALFAREPDLVMASPAQFQHLVERLPPDCPPVPSLTLASAGSALPQALSRTLRTRLTANLWNLYGSSETGLVARGQVSRFGEAATAAGWPDPGVRVEVVDQAGQPVALGVTGLVRVRTPEMASAYLDNPEASAAHFKDGWFYPGDIGLLAADGLLHVGGREDEVLNVGGRKVLAGALEQAVLGCQGVGDAAAFVAPDAAGASTLWIAAVRTGEVDQTEIAEAVRALHVPSVNFGWAKQIPRNARGKVQRDRLLAAVQPTLRAAPSSP